MGIYRKLYAHFGPRRWWPAETAFEVMIGAILTQNTAWTNVEKAIANLKARKLLTPGRLAAASLKDLRKSIRPSGFYKEKAKKLKNFVKFLFSASNGQPAGLGSYRTKNLRKMLLEVNGVGPETADSILLYGLKRTVFVADAYTKRIFARHFLTDKGATYGEIQKFFTDNLPGKRRLFNEYHALIVELGKNYCKKQKPLCKICPLRISKHREDMV